MQGWPPVLVLAACGGSILQVGGVAHTPANTASCSYIALHWHAFTNGKQVKELFLFILLSSVMTMSVASGVELEEWKRLHLKLSVSKMMVKVCCWSLES